MCNIQLSAIVTMTDPRSVLSAVKNTMRLIDPGFDLVRLDLTFRDVYELYVGKYPGYRECNTSFHDFQHTTDVFLATARLIHGAVLDGKKLNSNNILLCLFAALLHDSGYIQTEDDVDGTGAKYTAFHVERSIDFGRKYYEDIGLPENAYKITETMILTTDLAVKIGDIPFVNADAEFLGKVLGTADLIGQMADRTYLEKILFLFYEFKEGNIGGYESEFELLEKTVEFSKFVFKRLENDLGSLTRLMRLHFKKRWRMNVEPYTEVINRHLQYLQDVVATHKDDYREFLKRDGMIERLDKVYGHMM